MELEKVIKAVRFAENGDPIKDAIDDSEVVDALRLLVQLKEHIESGPLGWFHGTVRAARGTTDQDVIVWLATLRDLVGLSGIDD
jgi:hypothetical protein